MQKSRGFTLIEIMITISIFALTLGFGIPRYLEFNTSQTLRSAGETFKNNLRDIQGKALAGDKPADGYCINNPLYTWRVNFLDFTDRTSYHYQAWCGGPQPPYYPAGADTTYRLPNRLFFDDGRGGIPANVLFLPIGKGTLVGGVSGARFIRDATSTHWYGICVSKSGDVQDCGYSTPAPPVCSCEVRYEQ